MTGSQLQLNAFHFFQSLSVRQAGMKKRNKKILSREMPPATPAARGPLARLATLLLIVNLVEILLPEAEEVRSKDLSMVCAGQKIARCA